MGDDFDVRKRRTQEILDAIAERHGPEEASDWALCCTPIPCVLPSDEMLADGLRLAAGEVTLGELIAKAEAETERQMAYYEATQPNSKGETP